MTEEFGLSYPDWGTPSGSYPFTQIDNSELAVRLGAVGHLYRTGKVIHQWAMEDARLEGWYVGAVGTGYVASTTYKALNHSTITNIVGSAGVGDTIDMYQYLPMLRDEISGMEFTIQLTGGNGGQYFEIETRFMRIPGPSYATRLRLDRNGNISYQNAALVYTLIATTTWTTAHTIKAVTNYATGNILKLLLDDQEFAINAAVRNYGAQPTDYLYLGVLGTAAGGFGATALISDFIITTDEYANA